MLAITSSCAIVGLDGYPIKVEIDVSPGLPSLDIVGLPDASVREAKERVRTAIKNSGFTFPLQRITVNLAPADVKKEGPGFDLAIAIGILAASGQLEGADLTNTVLIGELSLEGSLRSIPGVLAMALALAEEAPQSPVRLLLPPDNSKEAAVLPGLQVYPLAHLTEVVSFLKGDLSIAPEMPQIDHMPVTDCQGLDFADVKGQLRVKRALEIAAAGNHNILLLGPPGSGKTLMARRLPSIMPSMTLAEQLEVTKIHSVAGLLKRQQGLINSRPFRAPHHTASAASIIGGGRIPRPGEVSLATHGVLFLDELPEYQKNVLEALRQPLEDKVVTVARATATISYPADFVLVAAMNPCPCGFLGDGQQECRCSPHDIKRYLSKISGPLLDRFDLQIEVPRLNYQEISVQEQGESSAEIKRRVEAARTVQQARLAVSGKTANGQMTGKEIKKYCQLTGAAEELLKQAFSKLNLSARSYDKILKVAKTIADLEGVKQIETHHIAEAISYRTLDRKYWQNI